MSDITTACESIKARAYCAEGNHQEWLADCAARKIKAGRVLSVTPDEAAALVAENWAIMNKGDSDGHF